MLSDDANSTGLQALGMGSFPGFVFVNSDGTVAARLTGELPVDADRADRRQPALRPAAGEPRAAPG